MPRYGRHLILAAAMACASVLAWGRVSRGEEAGAERGGILFYAGFDKSKDADFAAGNPKAQFQEGGGSLCADGFGFRGAALRTGDGEGYVAYSAEGNINAKQGTIEFWMYAQDWDHTDGHVHRLIDVVGKGEIYFYIRPPGVQEFVVRATGGLANTAYGCNPLKGRWSWYALTWQEGHPAAIYIGGIKASGGSWTHSAGRSGPTPEPEALRRILIGDFGGIPARQAHTLIDEVYIYNRALTREEVDWAAGNARTRKPGMDIPADFMKPKAKVVPDPAKSALVVEVDSGDRSGAFAGTARLEPPTGTAPAPLVPTEGRFGQAVIPYADLPEGEYNVIADITTKDGKPIASVTTKFVVPGPAVWLKEKVGVSDMPPPPWTPIDIEGDRVRVWGREYSLGAFGLPARVETQGASMLAGPVGFRAVSGGADVTWTQDAPAVSSRTAAKVVWEGTSRSALGELSWRTQAEYDGFLLHDFTLTPAAGAAVELMELRVPIRKEFTGLYSQGGRKRGSLPPGTGEIGGAGAGYWWIGTDDFGLCGAMEHGGAFIDGADGSSPIVREPNGDVTVIYRFAGKQTMLAEPWKLRLVLQATPTKPLPADWRTWRDASPFAEASRRAWRGAVPLWIAYPWPNEPAHRYFTFPVVKDPNWYRDHVKNLHAGGPGMWQDNQTVQEGAATVAATKSARNKVLPYGMFAFMAPGMPECDFYWKEWFNPLGFSSLGGGLYQYAAVRPVPSYIDFMIWKHRELIREYGHDGLYIDFAGICQPALDVEHGLGYERGGTQHPAGFPIVATREAWKRMYTMLHQEVKVRTPLIVGHTSENACAPILSFCDVWINGEGNWFGQLKDNYLDVLPLDELRAEWRAQHFGGVPWWIPAWQRAAALEDKDVAVRRSDGSVGTVSVEKTHHMLGIGLLLDIAVWPITGTNPEAARQLYAVQDRFGMGDVRFSGYWNNADVIGGQTNEIKASAYRKPRGGALVVVFNTAREARAATLSVAWDQLKSGAPLEVFDAYTQRPVAVSGKAVTLDVPPLNYRLLQVR